eukprot:7026015-Pyramimonas_sp.AAC.1
MVRGGPRELPPNSSGGVGGQSTGARMCTCPPLPRPLCGGPVRSRGPLGAALAHPARPDSAPPGRVP